MSEWMRHIRWKKVVSSGLTVAVLMFVLHQAEAMFTIGYYMKPEFSGVWSRIMMPSAGPPPAAFFAISALFTVATSVTLAAVFDFMKGSFGKGYWQRVVGFTDIMVGLMIVFGTFPMYLMFNVPAALLGYWLLTSFVSVLLGAMIFAKKMT